MWVRKESLLEKQFNGSIHAWMFVKRKAVFFLWFNFVGCFEGEGY
jgi:hypothetical protein